MFVIHLGITSIKTSKNSHHRAFVPAVVRNNTYLKQKVAVGGSAAETI